MKRSVLLYVSSLVMALVMVSCGDTKTQSPFSKGFEGMYVGELPCADCPGILTHITFYTDSTVALTSLYYESDGTSLTEWGKWEVMNSMLKVNLSDQSTRYFVQNSDSVILMTDSLGKSSETLQEHYLLRKEVAKSISDFEGHYVQGDKTVKGGYLQFLDVHAADSNELDIAITYEGAGKGCNFIGKGTLVNNQIEVDLSKHHEKFNSTMVIRFIDDNKILVAPSRFTDRYDLMYFCGGGGSLCGEYENVKE